MKMERKNDSRVKTRKGWKQENFWSFMGEANRKMKGQWPNSIWSLYEVFYPLQNQKFELLVPECFPSNSRVYHGGSWRLSRCHIQELKKLIFLKNAWFSKNSFFQKKALEMCHPFCSIKLWIFWARSSDSKSMPYSKIF